MIEDLHAAVGRVKALLDAEACWYETFEHEPVRTSEEAADTRPGYSLRQGAKAIILRVKRSKRDKFFVMLVFPADRRFDAKAVKDYFAARDIRFASADEVAELTGGVQPGGVPPFGNLFDLPLFATPELLKWSELSSTPAIGVILWRCAARIIGNWRGPRCFHFYEPVGADPWVAVEILT